MNSPQDAYEKSLCQRFLANPDLNPMDQSKKLRPGAGPYRNYVDLCRKHNFDVSRLVQMETAKEDIAYERRKTLRPRRDNGNLLAAVLLTAEDFQHVKDLPYEQFLSEVIAITNDNGGAIDRNYFSEKQYRNNDITIVIPYKYKVNRAGNDYIGFNKNGGFTNGELLYNLAPQIYSKFPEYFYFEGLSAQNDGSYKLELSNFSW